MNLEWVIPCRFAEVHDNLATIVGAGIDTYWVAELPTPIQVVLAVRFLATPEELSEGAAHSITNIIRNPAGETLHEQQGELQVAGEAVRPSWLVGSTTPMFIVFEVSEEGTYTIEVGIDASIMAVPIHVALGAPDAQ